MTVGRDGHDVTGSNDKRTVPACQTFQ